MDEHEVQCPICGEYFEMSGEPSGGYISGECPICGAVELFPVTA